MRKLITIILCLSLSLVLAFTGCRGNVNDGSDQIPAPTEKPSADPDNASGNDTGNEPDDSGNMAGVFKLSSKWSQVASADRILPALTIAGYESKVEPYSVKPDLSNIENISQFSGFSEEQVRMLSENGFVVLPGQSIKMFYTYDENEYLGIPNFVTADTVLHLYHQFYDKSLMMVESDYLYDDLENMTRQMLDNSLELLEALHDDTLKDLQKKNVAYFLVAGMLMGQPLQIADAELASIAESEYDLIEKAGSYQRSPLFGIDLDYSQFKIRGHYTRSDKLGRLFRTLMWYGTAPLELIDSNNEFRYENTLQAMLMTFTTFLDSDEACSAEYWTNIYKPTGQYVGLPDDINVFQMNGVRMSVFGEDTNPDNFGDDDYYEKLTDAVKALPEPKIKAKLTTVTTPAGKQFRYMGQRYVLDSYIMQNLMEPILRPVPSGLDVMGVLGSPTAEDLIFDYYKPQELWPEYEGNYNKLKSEVAGYSEDIWGSNLYNGWIWSIKETLTEFGETSGMPSFMTNDAWRKKSLNTALGSYTELKHDTVLYGKQPAAEMGGPVEHADQHYVEPDIPLYCKLLYLTDNTISLLNEIGVADSSLLDGAYEYKALLELLVQCSIKELRNESLTEQEKERLLWYGGTMEYIMNSFAGGMGEDYSFHQDLSDMLVSDIATTAPNNFSDGGYLTLGTGYFDQIYVVVPADGKLYLSRGSVYSHYEFLSDTRLTDEEWWALHGLIKMTGSNIDYFELAEPSESLPGQPFWVEAFKTGSNRVDVKPLEVDWDNLNE